MNYGEIAIFVVTIAAGVVGLALLIFFFYMLIKFLTDARPVEESARREEYPMDRSIHKAQMGVAPNRGGGRDEDNTIAGQ